MKSRFVLHLLCICSSAAYIIYTSELQTHCHVIIMSYNARSAVWLDYIMLHFNCMTLSNLHFYVHSAYSSNGLPDIYTTRTSAFEVHVSVITEWLPEYLNKLPQRGHQGGHWRKQPIKDVSNLISIQVFKLHGFFVCVFQWFLWGFKVCILPYYLLIISWNSITIL